MLTDKQKKACALLHEGRYTVQEVAEAVGVHRCTIWRWWQQKAFQSEYRRLVRQSKRNLMRWLRRRLARDDAKLKDAEEKLMVEAAKIKKTPTKAFNTAWEEYNKALLHGKSWEQLLSAISCEKPSSHKDESR